MSVPRAESLPADRRTGELTVDRLQASAAVPLQVLVFDAFELADGAREPHRHDYHELIWVREGVGRHLVDGREVPVVPGSITVIGRGQVHVFERAQNVVGAVIRFGDELLHEGSIARSDPSWVLASCGALLVDVPREHHDAIEHVIRILHAEAGAAPDVHSADLQRHLLSVVLVWIERWYDAEHDGRGESDDSDVQLFRRFARMLEHDFAAHHDAAHYADALRVPPAALSQALTRLTGRSTKELVTDRVMLEAARLLRFTDRTIGEISHATGFGDPLYFSRAFKRHHGLAPSAYRDSARGLAVP